MVQRRFQKKLFRFGCGESCLAAEEKMVIRMDNRPIGVFDSGLGGLTAVRELMQVLPRESIIYFGDTGRVPYGTRGAETIRKYTRQDIAFLKTNGVKMILAACGTVSSVAGEIGETCGLPFTGVLRPTAEAAIRETRTGRIGVIGTQATVSSGSYERHVKALAPEAEVFSCACPLFVPLVENGVIAPEDPIVRLTAERYLCYFEGKGIDTLILGCTHYPILHDSIAAVMGSGVTLINSGREAALRCVKMLEEKALLCGNDAEVRHRFFVSDQVEGFHAMADICLGHTVDADVQFVDIDRYPA